MILRISLSSAKEWANNLRQDWEMSFHPLGRAVYVADVKNRTDFFSTFSKFISEFVSEIDVVVFRGHAKGVTNLAIDCGFVSCVCDIDNGNFSGHRFVGDKKAITKILERFKHVKNKKANFVCRNSSCRCKLQHCTGNAEGIQPSSNCVRGNNKENTRRDNKVCSLTS